MKRYIHTIKRWCFASLVGIGLMNVPGMAYVLWLGNMRSNVLFSKEHVNLGVLLPVINRDRSILWFEGDIVDIDIPKVNSKFKTTVDNLDVGIAGRYVWTPQLIVGAYLFANTNTADMSILDLVKLEESFDINPGFEVMWPRHQVSLHFNGIRIYEPNKKKVNNDSEDKKKVNNGSEDENRWRRDHTYYKWAWKAEKKFDNCFAVSCGTYHTKYYDSPILSSIALGVSYSIWDALSVFGNCYYDLQERDSTVSAWNVGIQWQIGKTAAPHNRVKHYLRQPLDRHIGPVKPFKKDNVPDRIRASWHRNRQSRSASQSSEYPSTVDLSDSEEDNYRVLSKSMPELKTDTPESSTPRSVVTSSAEQSNSGTAGEKRSKLSQIISDQNEFFNQHSNRISSSLEEIGSIGSKRRSSS